MRNVLEVLLSFGPDVFIKQARLAKKCKLTKGTLVRMLDELKRDGKISTTQRGPTSCLYFVKDRPRMAKPLAKAMAKPLAKAYRFYPYMSKYLSEEEQRASPSEPVEKTKTPDDEEWEKIQAFAIENDLQICTGADIETTIRLMRAANGAQDKRGAPAGERTIPTGNGLASAVCVPLAERARESVSGEVAAGSLPPQTHRKRPQVESRDPASWNAAIASLASRKSLGGGL